MRNSGSVNNDRLDEMLENYYGRDINESFAVRLEEKTMTKRNIYRYALAGLCVAVLLSAGLFAGNIFGGTSDKAIPVGFSITAKAADIPASQPKKIDSVAKAVCEKNYGACGVLKTDSEARFGEDGILIDDADEYGTNFPEEGERITTVAQKTLYFRGMNINVSGDNISSIDLSCQDGKFTVVDMEAMAKYKNSGNDGDIDKYFKSSKEIKGIQYKEGGDNAIDISWLPSDDRFNAEIMKTEGLEEIDYTHMDDVLKVSEATDKLLQSAEDYNSYFGDALTITVHYNDGTSESANIEVSYDDNGGFLVNYK